MFGANPYRSTTAGVITGLTRGQWVKLDGYAKPGRFVGYNPDGSSYIVKPNVKTRKGVVSRTAFSLACQKHRDTVLGRMPVQRTVKNGLTPHHVPVASRGIVELLTKFS